MLIAMLPTLGCPPSGEKLAPAAGLPQYQERALVDVPGGVVNPLGGNLLVRRSDLVIDTRLGTREVGATYNSTSGEWRWSFDIRYDGVSFIDPTGASHDTSSLAPGDAIPGTFWVIVDADTIKTKGGLAHEFGPDSHLRAVHYTSAEYPRLDYISQVISGEPRTVAIDQCTAPAQCTSVFVVSHDQDGLVVSIGDRAGRLATFEYSAGRLVRARDGLDTAQDWPGTLYEYAGEKLTAVVNSEGERVEYVYAGRRVRMVRAVGGEHPLHQFDYFAKNAAGLYATRYVDPLGQITWLRYDERRRLREREVVGVGELLSLAWEGLRVVAEVRPSGVITRWRYQGDDVESELQPSGNEVHFRYAADAVNRQDLLQRALLDVVDSIGLRERRSYDVAGRLTAVENGAGEVVASYSYASDESISSFANPSRVISYAAYGEHGHPTQISISGVSISNVYDSVGNLLQGWNGVAAELGGVVSREYDEDRNPRRITVADAGYAAIPLHDDQTIEISYRSDHRRRRITRPGGGDHEFEYDALGRLTELRERVDGAWVATHFAYDAAGRCTATERANGMRREVRYDAAGRIRSIRSLRGAWLESTADFDYAEGLLRSVEDSSRGGAERYTYDAAGRVHAIEHPDGEVLLQLYDLRSRRIQEVFLADSLLRGFDHGYDLADRAVSVADSGQPLLAHQFQDGRLVATSYGNGLVRSYSYDPTTGHMVGARTEGPGGAVEESTILWENAGGFSPGLHVTAVTTTFRGVAATTNETYRLGPGVDASGEQPSIGSRVYMWSDEVNLSAYEYDALSNATGSAAFGEGFEYNNERNRLLSATTSAAGTLSYSYDEAGFVIARRGVPLTWTASGRLASVGSDVVLEWDALDRRVRSSVMGEESRWLFGGRVQADASGRPTAIDFGAVRVDLTGSARHYRHLDFRGNVKFVSNQDGEIRSHYQYDAYGLRQLLGSQDDSVRFAARSQIGELMLMGARVYDPAVARFLSPDPILQSVNQYAYTLGNPVWFSDASGQDFEAVLDGIVAVGGLATATAGLFLVATPTGAVVAGVAFTLGTLDFAFWVAHALNGDFASMDEDGLEAYNRLVSRSLGDVSGANQTCSPLRLASIPSLGRLYWVLIALQLMFAPLLLRSCTGRRRGRGR